MVHVSPLVLQQTVIFFIFIVSVQNLMLDLILF